MVDESRTPRASVVIPTLDRPHFLRELLQRLAPQARDLSGSSQVPGPKSQVSDPRFSGRCEVIVVDNRGAAEIARLVNEEARSFPVPLAYVAEPDLGVARARNAGLAQARGEIVAYLDDDVLPDRDWLRAIDETFRTHEAAQAVGGRVLPLWQSPRPKWLSSRALARLGVLDLSQVCEIRHPQWINGANMAFRREVLIRSGGFAADFGHRGSVPYGSEEPELCRRLERDGATILFTPAATVHHRITPAMVQPLTLLRRAFFQGRADARLARRYGDARLEGQRRGLRVLTAPIEAAVAALRGDLPRAMDCADDCLDGVGFVVTFLSLRERPGEGMK